MRPLAVLVLAGIAMMACASGNAQATPPSAGGSAVDQGFAQAAKPRPKIRVYRGYPYRRTHSAYPLPYDVEYPGPYGVRQCANRYVTERRPSGNVIVPHMRCWWVVRR